LLETKQQTKTHKGQRGSLKKPKTQQTLKTPT